MSNRLFYGDNLDVLRNRVADQSVDLVYLDPPFNSNRNYNVIFSRHEVVQADQAQIQAFDDTWHWSPDTDWLFTSAMAGSLPSRVSEALSAMRILLGENDAMAYLVNMAPRLVELHRVLRPTGALYLHCDPTMSHYLKVLLDTIFGPEHFVNEVVWQRTAAKGDARRKFGSVHDVLLSYAKSDAYEFKPVYVEKDEAYNARFRLDDHDGRGPYRLAPLDSPNPRPNLTYEYKGYRPPAKGWRVSREVMEQLDAEGRLAFPRNPTGRISRKHYLSEQKGRKASDVWTDIAPLQASSAERLGYPTQKPLALVERILNAASKEGDVVLDPFCGCGTAIDAAHRLGRAWIGIDITYIAVDLIEKRLRHTYGDSIVESYDVLGIPKDTEGALALFDRSPFEFERWAVSLLNAQPNVRQVGDRGIDGVIRFHVDAKGTYGKALVSVKGGQHLGPQYVRDLVGTVQTQHAQMGVLTTMRPPTRGMFDAASHAGNYTWPVNGQVFPRVQLATVPDLLAGRKPVIPPSVNPYIAAARISGARGDQLSFDPYPSSSGKVELQQPHDVLQRPDP